MKAIGTVLILVLTLTCAAATQAQMTSYGVKGGLTIAKLTGDTEGLKTRTGFMIGGFAAIPVAESGAFQPEIYYSEKGTKETILDTDVSYKLAYIDIPLLFKYTMAGESARPYLLAGPSIGFLTSAKAKGGGQTVDFKDLVKSTDFGLVFGLGVNMQKFLLEGRYNLGLTNINDDPDFPDESIKNGVWNILVGVSF